MKDQQQQNQPRSRAKRNLKSVLFRFLYIGIALAFISFFLSQYTNIKDIKFLKFKDSANAPVSSNDTQSKPKTVQQSLNQRPGYLDTKTSVQPVDKNKLSEYPGISTGNEDSTPSQQDIVKIDDINDTYPANDQTASPAPYLPLLDDLNGFYAHLDQQPYMKDFQLRGPSKKHFSKLLQILIDNPPATTREADDYFTLLKNTAHFFRVLGKENIIVLKGILDREKGSFENIVKSFYSLIEYPEPLKNEFGLIIPEDNLYEYAGFFLNSIGGRLYLFRRDSVSRMTISYYAVLIIDAANRKGNNRHGIDLRPPINSLIKEIENGGNNLKYKAEYLDKLYDLKEYYDNRG